MTQEQEEVKNSFLRDATDPSNNFTDNQAMFMWNYIMMAMITMDKMRHEDSLK